MKRKKSSKINYNIVIGTGAILAISFVMSQISSEWNWDLTDFIIIGILLLGACSLYVFAVQKFPKYRVALAILFVLTVMYVWAELAVGIFTNLGS